MHSLMHITKQYAVLKVYRFSSYENERFYKRWGAQPWEYFWQSPKVKLNNERNSSVIPSAVLFQQANTTKGDTGYPCLQLWCLHYRNWEVPILTSTLRRTLKNWSSYRAEQEEWWKDQSECFTVWDARWSIYLTHQRDGLEVTWSVPMRIHMGNRNLIEGSPF